MTSYRTKQVIILVHVIKTMTIRLSAWPNRLTILVSLCLFSSTLLAVEPIRIGVSAEHSISASNTRWQPLAQALQRALPGEQVIIEVYPPAQLVKAIYSRQLDFVLMEPNTQILMARRIGLSAPLASLINDQGGVASPAYGGVIFVKADRRDINNSRDLLNRRIATTSKDSFSGYQMQAYELLLAGVDIAKSATIKTTDWPEANVVKAVQQGDVDAGLVRTGTLEALAQRGEIQLTDYRVIDQDKLPGFKAASSTHLFPEWSFSALPHVRESIARKVAAALYQLADSDNATTKALGIFGFTIPSSYLSVENVLSSLRAPPFDSQPEFTTLDVIHKYQWQFISAIVTVVIFLILAVALARKNRSLAFARQYLETQKLQLTDSQTRLQGILDYSPVAIFWANADGRIEYINDQFTDIFGYSLNDIHTLDIWFKLAFPNPTYLDEIKTIWRASAQQAKTQQEPIHQLELSVCCKDGEQRHVLLSGTWTGDLFLANFSDITERKHSEVIIQTQANYDQLTSLPNRRLFLDRLEQVIKTSARTGNSAALMFIDLDHFKQINDTLGHSQGDILLIEAAARISACVRQSDTVARLGGDEFTVILSDLSGNYCAEKVAEKILLSLTAPFRLNKELGYISASIGIALFPNDAANSEDLIKHADQAMYAAKARGRNGYQYFTQALQQAAQSHMRLANDLRAAIHNNQFELFYQPIIELSSGNIYKAEALIRWHHPDNGIMAAEDFIAVAAESETIIDIGDWVLKEAARQVKLWRTTISPDFQISINKSTAQFSSINSTYKKWLQHLEHINLSGTSICIEITEELLQNAEVHIVDELLAFRDAGIQIAIDDFGSGRASLSQLKKFNIDYLKIDQNFVKNIAHSNNDQVFCSAIIMMAHKLGLKVIAEGVETALQRDILTQAQCDYAQGFLFSPALPSDLFENMLIQHPSAVS
jgi:diguanylate cyclase (GGDEF)-like protein/PAS domain S-box-containing protein